MYAQSPEGDQHIRYEFEVRRVWKGDVPEKVAVVSHKHSATCGRHFEVGVTYLVYARSRDGVLRDGLCSRTRPIDKADEDLAALGEGHPPGAAPAEGTPEGGEVEEPPRVEPPAPTGDGAPNDGKPAAPEPPPSASSPRGCAIGHPAPAWSWLLAPVAVAAARRRRRRDGIT